MSQYGFVHTESGVVSPVRRMPSNVQSEIKPGFYTFCPGGDGGPHLHSDEPMKLPKEVYGDGHNNVDRYFRSYELNDKNLGISLVGLKGSGKTLQAKQICIKAVEMGYPVISIERFIPAEILSAFLKKIEQNVVVFIDEFDKHYYSTVSSDSSGQQANFDAQDGFLSMLDGANSSGKKMFVLTSNNPDKMSDLFKDRPSRIRYNVRFDLLPSDVLRDYVSRNLRNATEHDVAGFCYLKGMLNRGFGPNNLFGGSAMNFDTMKELVHEMSQFKETLRESWLMMKFGNHNPPGITHDPYPVDYRIYDLSTGVNLPAYMEPIPEGSKSTEEIPVFCVNAKMAIKQLHFHREDSSFLDSRSWSRGNYVKLNERILKDHYGYKDLLCYDRSYQPVYIHGDIIIASEAKQWDTEEVAVASLEYHVIRDDKKEVPSAKKASENPMIINALPMNFQPGVFDTRMPSEFGLSADAAARITTQLAEERARARATRSGAKGYGDN